MECSRLQHEEYPLQELFNFFYQQCGNMIDLRDIIMPMIEDALLEDAGLPQVHVFQQPQLVPSGDNVDPVFGKAGNFEPQDAAYF